MVEIYEEFKSFTISYWPDVFTVSAEKRKAKTINSFEDDYNLFKDITPLENKSYQKTLTRVRRKSREHGAQKKGGYRVGLDFDSTDHNPYKVHNRLIDLKINHILYTTYGNRVVEGKYDGSYRFKVLLYTFVSKDQLKPLTQSLCAHVGKEHKADDMSDNIFFGNHHPKTLEKPICLQYTEGYSPDRTIKFLLESFQETSINDDTQIEKKSDKETYDWELHIQTGGQKYDIDRIKKDIKYVKYEEIGPYSKMQIWHNIGFAFKSTCDDELFEVWDSWCEENCSEYERYDRKENENLWNKPDDTSRPLKDRVTLSTFWQIVKLFKAKAEFQNNDCWTFFSQLAKEKPPEIKYIIKNLIPENSIGFLVGEGGIGKSTFCLELAKTISSGECLYGDENFKSEKGTVVVVNKEDNLIKIHNQVHYIVDHDIEKEKEMYTDFETERVDLPQDKIEYIKNKWENVVRPAWAQSSIRLTVEKKENDEAIKLIINSISKLKKILKDNNRPDIKLIIFDPLNMFHGGDQNNQTDMSSVFSAFQQIQRKFETTVLVCHHKNKTGTFSGSHTLRDSGRFMFYLQKPKDIKLENHINLYVEKSNDAKAGYTALNFIRTDKGLLERSVLPKNETGK